MRKKPFDFKSSINSVNHEASNAQELIKLCKSFEEDAKRYLENGDFEKWLDYIEELDLAKKIREIKEDDLNSEEKLKKFIDECEKSDKRKWRETFFSFGNKNFWELFGLSLAGSILAFGVYIAQTRIQDQITKTDKEKAVISEHINTYEEKQKYQQTALDTYINSITDLLKKVEISSASLRTSLDSNANDTVKPDTFKIIARTKTLTTLYLLYLDKERRSLLISFLRDAGFLTSPNRITLIKIISLLDKSQKRLNETYNNNKISAVITNSKEQFEKINECNESNKSELKVKKDGSIECSTIEPPIKSFLIKDNLNDIKKEIERLSDSENKEIIVNNIDEAIKLRKTLISIDPNINISILEGIQLENIDLSKVDLRQASLKRANLTTADLREGNLSDADMEDSILNAAILKDASLIYTNLKNAKLISTDLRNATLTLANLQGADLKFADLRNADLSQAVLDGNDGLANLSQSDLRGAWFVLIDNKCPSGEINKDGLREKIDCPDNLQQYPDYPIRDSDIPSLKDALYDDETQFPPNFNPEKKGMIKISDKCNPNDPKKCKENSKSLNGVFLQNTDLTKADLSHANLTEANLNKTNLRGTDFTKAILKDAKFDKAVYNDETIWNGATWDKSKPKLEGVIKIYPGVNLQGKDLTGLNLRGFDLKGANLSKAILRSADLREADLNNADLSEANLQNARINDNTLDGVYLCATILPNGNISDKNCGTSKPKDFRVTLWVKDRWQNFVDWIYTIF